MVELKNGNCVTVMKTMASDSIDAIVTDPPYEIGFMYKSWDSSGVAYNVGMWREALRVLKHGGYLLSFGGSRTYHRMACAIEDAGFEVLGQAIWAYGSGFPKSHNISKKLDSMAGAKREVVREYYGAVQSKASVGGGFNGSAADENGRTKVHVTRPTTPIAKGWDGWGTALKPSHEPIVVARKGGPECGPAPDVRFFYSSKAGKSERDRGCEELPVRQTVGGGGMGANDPALERVAHAYGSIKAPHNNFHPTVKPVSVMSYLIELVAPEGGVVLDPFMGSGTTGVAARRLKRDFVGIELNAEYIEIAKKRINHAESFKG